MGSLTWNTKNIPDLSGKCFIVTGGNSGVGYECAKELALHGAHVIIATHGQRPGGPSPADAVDGPGAVSKIKEAKSDANVEYMECDLASFRSIRSFVDAFKSRQLPLNGLINNAGLQTPPDAKTEDGFEITIGVNFFGPFYLTQLLLPSLKASTPSRVVWVSSPEETIAEPDWNDMRGTQFSTDIKSYACSKLWDLMAAIELNDRLNGTGVESFACHPGMCRTDLFRKGDHDKMATQITDWAQWLGGQTAASGALPLLYCATAPELQGKGGTYYGAYYKGPWTPNLFNTSQRTPGHADANNQELRRKLYDEAVNICNEVAGGKRIQSKPTGAAAADVSGPPVQIETLEEKKARGGEAWVATRKKSDSGSGAAGEGGAAGGGDGVTVESVEKAPGGLAWEAHSKRSGADESSQLPSGAAQGPAHPADTVADTAGKPVQVQNVEKAAGGLAWDAKPQGAAAGAAPASGAGGAGGVAAGIQGAVASGKEAISNLADKVSQGVASMGIGGDKTGEKRHVPYGQGISPADAPAGMTAE